MAFQIQRDRMEKAQSQTGNPYQDSPEKGLNLVARIVSGQRRPDAARRQYWVLNNLLVRKLPGVSARVNLKNELELYARLISLSDRLSVPYKYQMLKNCSIVGIGGMFSAGKSCFLNSLLGEDFPFRLPVDQNPSTSAPTYILGGRERSAEAVTAHGSVLPLDGDAIEAISHKFYDKYELRLAQYLSYLSVRAPEFAYSKLALLDTPGYNKPDTGVKESEADKRKAYSQLHSIDYLIWLISVKNGTINQTDIEFIRRLELSTKILVVVNQCDLVTPDETDNVVKAVRRDAGRAQLNLFDVVPYSSHYPDDFGGQAKIRAFFAYAEKGESRVEDVRKEIENICQQLESRLRDERTDAEQSRNAIGSAIFRSQNVMEIKSLCYMYGNVNRRLSDIRGAERRFQATRQDILERLRVLGKES